VDAEPKRWLGGTVGVLKRLTATFWIAMPIAVVAIGFALRIVLWGVGMHRAFDHERVTPLATVACDLSKVGEYDIPINVTYPYGHGFKLLVEGPAQVSKEAWEPEPWLAELNGAVQVASGPYVPEAPVELMKYLSFASGPDSRAIVRVYGSSPGEWLLRLRVTAGAKGLEGVPHKIVIYNDVCGCELLAAFYGFVLAGGLGVLGLVAGGIGVGMGRRKGGAVAR
jgi:hypothetical protein